MKKLLSVCLAVLMLLSVTPLNALAWNDGSSDVSYWYIEDAYVYEFMRDDDGVFGEYYLNLVTVYADGSTSNEAFWLSRGKSHEHAWGSLSCSDNQDTTRWEAGETYQITYNDNQYFNMEVRETPIEKVEFDDCAYCYFDTELEKYLYRPHWTIYLSNGDTETGNHTSYDVEFYDVWYQYDFEYVDTQDTQNWVVGETYEVTGSILGVSDTFNITVTTVQDVQIEDVTYIEGDYDCSNSGWDDQDNPVEWDSYSAFPDNITVFFTDGSSVSGDVWGVEEQTGLPCWYDSEQSYENQWGAGEHTATFCIGNFEKEYTVIVEENPVESIQVEDMTVTAYTNGYYMADGSFYYYVDPDDVTITLKDGTVIEDGYFQWNDEEYWVDDNGWELQSEVPWEVGGTYTVTATLLGVTDTFSVTIEEPAIESIEIQDMAILEGDENNGNYYDGNFYYDLSYLNFTITLKDGTTQTVTDNSWFEMDGEYFQIENNATELQKEEPWTAGNTYTVTGTVLGVSDTFEVTIEPSFIDSFVVKNVTLYEGLDNANGQSYYDVPVELVSAHLKDGSLGEIIDGSLVYEDEYYWASTNAHNLQEEEPWAAGNTYTVTATLLGKRTTFTVTIQENPIKSVTLLKAPDATTCFVNQSINLKGAIFRVTYTDGTYEDFSFNTDFTSAYYKELYLKKVDRSDYLYLPDATNTAGPQVIEVELFGHICEIPITAKANLMESLSIKENADKTITITVHNSDNSTYDMKMLDIAYLLQMEENTYLGSVLTDKGSFYCCFYSDDTSFILALILYDDEEVTLVESNTIAASKWFEVQAFVTQQSSWLPTHFGSDQTVSFSGTVNAENIDAIIEIAGDLDNLWYSIDLAPIGEYGYFDGDDVRAAVKKHFGVNNINLALSKHYNADTDTYTYQYPLGLGLYDKACPGTISYANGVWTATNTMNTYDNGQVSTIRIQLNEQMQIIGLGINEEKATAKDGWNLIDGKWYFYQNGVKATNKWMKDSKGWVYLGADGAMVTNKWVTDSKGWCYVGADGYAVTNCWKKDSKGWCYLDANGSMTKSKWVKDNGKWYYLDANGYMATNKWQKDSKGWVKLGADGAMLTNKWTTDSKGWCYVGADGYAVTSTWKKDSKGWIYLDVNGSMTKAKWVQTGGKWYYCDTNGYMVANETVTISGKKYTFNASGVWVK